MNYHTFINTAIIIMSLASIHYNLKAMRIQKRIDRDNEAFLRSMLLQSKNPTKRKTWLDKF